MGGAAWSVSASQANPGRCLDWTRVQSVDTLEASRTFRFRPEERGALLTYLGIHEDSFVAEVGCGTGVLAGHLAAGIPGGFVLGVDITSEFVGFARSHHRDLPNVDFIEGDACALPVADGTVDAATSYTLLAILPDPGAALRGQMRVTKRGGVVSGMEVVRSNVRFGGRPLSAMPAEEAERLSFLRDRWERITQEHVFPLEKEKHGYGWEGEVVELPLLFESVGLRDVRLRGFFSTFSTSDETYTMEERRWFLSRIVEEELVGLDQGWTDWCEVYVRHGLSDSDREELRRLMQEEHALRLRDFEEGRHVWAWHGTANLIVAGRN
jgi:SAM-dependent methyltransferase